MSNQVKSYIPIHTQQGFELSEIFKFKATQSRTSLEKVGSESLTLTRVVTAALGVKTPNLDKWLQQIAGTTLEVSVQKSVVLRTAKILYRLFKLPGLCVEDPNLRITHIPNPED